MPNNRMINIDVRDSCGVPIDTSDNAWSINDVWHIPSVKVCQTEKHRCSYCQSNSPDDMRGNCNACGAPRGNDYPHFRYAMNNGLSSAEWHGNNLVSAEVAKTWLGMPRELRPSADQDRKSMYENIESMYTMTWDEKYDGAQI